MSQSPTLQSLGIRWPTPGDTPFARSHSRDDTHIPQDASRFELMTFGYHLAADNLVQTTIDDPSTRPNLVFPIIFCYRHSLELALKYIIAEAGPSVGVAPNWRSHDLTELWSAYLDICEALDAKDDDGDAVVANCVAEFAKIDVASFSFRYPTDRNGNDIPLGIDALNLAQLRDVMGAVSTYFYGAAEYLDHLARNTTGT